LVLSETQAVEDTGNQIAITKFSFQEMVMSLLTLVELHPGILGSHMYLCQTTSNENLFFNFLIPSLKCFFCVFSECICLRRSFVQIRHKKILQDLTGPQYFKTSDSAIILNKSRRFHCSSMILNLFAGQKEKKTEEKIHSSIHHKLIMYYFRSLSQQLVTKH